ncbi:hypothetical protein PDJAM_G00220040 [Pangasius djambal]|uniref:Uncharacterized protein n=1 Tax=Pangasius djambal TaxID=1691987 RepID=A0ACC5YDJ7_9TELE|nr:hypothetical protein [Pangasius djambal]
MNLSAYQRRGPAELKWQIRSILWRPACFSQLLGWQQAESFSVKQNFSEDSFKCKCGKLGERFLRWEHLKLGCACRFHSLTCVQEKLESSAVLPTRTPHCVTTVRILMTC